MKKGWCLWCYAREEAPTHILVEMRAGRGRKWALKIPREHAAQVASALRFLATQIEKQVEDFDAVMAGWSKRDAKKHQSAQDV